MNRAYLTGMLLGALLLSAQPLSAQTCNNDITATAPDSRYTDNGNGTVTDSQSGLMWRQCSQGQSTTTTACDTGTAATHTWQEALQQAQNINNGTGFAGYTDWRLPNRNELASLIENSCYSPSINMTAFPNTVSADYWSSSPSANFSLVAWVVDFYVGNIKGESKLAQLNTFAVRLVRGGQ